LVVKFDALPCLLGEFPWQKFGEGLLGRYSHPHCRGGANEHNAVSAAWFGGTWLHRAIATIVEFISRQFSFGDPLVDYTVGDAPNSLDRIIVYAILAFPFKIWEN
jgi:hypothetical protein